MRDFITQFWNTFRIFISRGAQLRREIPERVHRAALQDWSPAQVEAIRSDLVPHFRDVSRYSLLFSALIFVPLCVVIATILRVEKIADPLESAFVWWTAFVMFLSVWPFAHLIPIIRAIRKIPQRRNNAVYRDLVSVFWFNADVFCISLNAALLLYALMAWRISVASPLVVLLVIAWLFAPWTAYVAKLDIVYAYTRVGQTLLAFIAAILVIASPVPMEDYQWWAQRKAGEALIPSTQKEVTADWATIRWFTQTGVPNVWSSGNPKSGYRLFDSPGHDPQTNEKLQPVVDAATKDRIVRWFTDKKKIEDEQAAIENQKRAAEAETQKQRDQAKHIAEQAAEEKAKQQQLIETKERLVREYVYASAVGKSGAASVVVIALNADNQEDSALSEEFSNLLSGSGYPNTRSVFTPAFIKSGYFQGLLSGNTAPGQPFDAGSFASKALVLQIRNIPSANVSVEGADMTAIDSVCDVRLISFPDSRLERSRQFKARGVGFNQSDAAKVALDRIEKEIAKFTPSLTAQTSSAK